jgi:hypothetical protein
LEVLIYKQFTVTEIFKKFKDGSDYPLNFKGLLLKASSETSGIWKKFTSAENTVYTSQRPYIDITYNDSPLMPCPQVVSGAVYHIKTWNVLERDYLDVYNGGTTDNTRLWRYSFNGSAAQQFQIVNTVGGEYKIIPQNATNKVLSVNSSKQMIIEQDCELSRQRWYIYYNEPSGGYHFVNKAYTTLLMEGTGDTDYVGIGNSYTYDQWELVPTINYPDTMTDQNTQDRIRAYKEIYYQAAYAYQRGEVTLAEKNKMQESFEIEMDVARADYIITGNNPQSDYAYTVLGGTRTGSPQWPFTRDLVYDSINPMTGLDVVIIQRVMALYGYYDGDYGTFDAETNQTVWDWKGMSSNQGTVDRYEYQGIFSSSNLAERTTDLVAGLKLFRLRHDTVKLYCVPILGAVPEVTINVPGGYKGRAGLVC